MTAISRLERVPLREVWPHEALDFTTWLEANTDVLSEHIGTELTNVQREQAAGAFSVDLVAEDELGDLVVIENQLERSDHDHLGKLITYLTAFEAKTAVWIVSEPRPEHITAVAWLNQTTPVSFFLLKVEALRIADSPAAPLLTRIVGPSAESRVVGERKQERSEQHAFFQDFWQSLIDKAASRTPSHAIVTPGRASWLWGNAGKPGMSYVYNVVKDGARLELAITFSSRAKNQAIFDRLKVHREAIEESLGHELLWDDAENRKNLRISWWLDTRGLGHADVAHRDELQEIMITSMVGFQQALQPHIDQLTFDELLNADDSLESGG